MKSRWEPLSTPLGTDKDLSDQTLSRPVPTVPTVPSEKQDASHRTAAEAAAEALEAWEERAAILQFDGGWSRAEAEHKASEELGTPPAV